MNIPEAASVRELGKGVMFVVSGKENPSRPLVRVKLYVTFSAPALGLVISDNK